MMKKNILLTALLALAAVFAFADDGGSYRPEDWSYGNIYVKEPNDKIALENELLVVEQEEPESLYYDTKTKSYPESRGGGITALFDFKNTTNERVTVPCAFPMVVSTKFAVKSDGAVSHRIHIGNGDFSDEKVLSLALQKKMPARYSSGDWTNLNTQKDELLELDKKLSTLKASSYYSLLKRIGLSESVFNSLAIAQDGKSVPVLTVGIETTVEKDPEMTARVNERNKGEEIYTLTLALHFYHELVFAPGARSFLRVKYDTDTKKSIYHLTYDYHVLYDISTGGTWKGSIKNFVVLTDSTMEAKNSSTQFDVCSLGNFRARSGNARLGLYTSQNYKPGKDEYFEFSAKIDFFEMPNYISEIKEERQPFVTNIRASSELPGTFKMAGKYDKRFGLSPNEDKNLRESTYKAETSFDGIPWNGWVEGANGDGKGEWIEFTLTSCALGPFATNGLRRFGGEREGIISNDFYNDANEKDFSTFLKTRWVGNTWESNNRIKTMLLIDSADKTEATLQFADLFPEFYSELGNGEMIYLNAVRNPLFLEKGTYRLQIDSVYKGKKWDDTVLGEVWFVPVSDAAGEIIFGDNSGFFRNELTAILQDYVSNYVSGLEYVYLNRQ